MKKIKPIRSHQYIEYIKEQSCDGCGQPRISDMVEIFPAHVTIRNKYSVKGTGIKDHDICCLPICSRCWYFEQQKGRSFWTARVDIDERILYHWARFIKQYPASRPFFGMNISGMNIEEVMRDITK